MRVLSVSEGAKRAELFKPKGIVRKQKTPRLNVIYYPSDPSESEIQYMIFGALRKMGIDARAEVFSKDKKSRFDIVIFKEQKPIGIIEVKKRAKAFKRNKNVKHDGVGENNHQKVKYSQFNLPLRYCLGMKNVIDTLHWSKRLHSLAVPVLNAPGCLGEIRPL